MIKGKERKERNRKERGGEERRQKEERRGANAAANLSVWKGIMPVLNLAARLGRKREREKRKGQSDSCIMLQIRCLYFKICFLKLCAHQKLPKNVMKLK